MTGRYRLFGKQVDISASCNYNKRMRSLKIYLIAIIAVAAASIPVFSMAGGTFVVVLDPGHGGVDDGAKGSRGTREKDVVLRIAKKISDKLSDQRDIKVYMTRTTDDYVSLEKRTTLANSIKADIFVSIHANAARRKAARGVETFFLSMDSSDDDARELALYENESGVKDKSEQLQTDDLNAILRNLESNVAHRESSALAELVHSKVVPANAVDRRGVKQAPFMVLNGAAMPAVLVEVGFISNRADEKELASDIGQDKIAKSIADGILGFRKLQTSTAVNTNPIATVKK